ncbi:MULTISPECIES: peptide chain release factor N(5)-glutamine methyltransferase [unclassified Ruminococcus]|uniref:peptide chain release factor N(5)-glutamine methyltransferase n=1 Tax=unclassified Ruminococcus TaxID=2608920 RepID=UPI00210E7525|nr:MULTISPECIES: peptide chain release factor N(5)-glutamine methyltransferase [unclassified Ruminococcus]MCQ4021986.1 peptide chain release factor N(5)-glutamine methyltransferase [Ruminococcus sp. zg-924]MCQ4114522.1 peptide chain release factor N(5)-glutamine methyltransferase [Ruminococcus sp. zg-921]
MTLNELYIQTKQNLKKAGVDSPVFDALCLFEQVFSLNRHGLIIHGCDNADPQKEAMLNTLANRRANGEPLQYILGKWQFMGNDFYVGTGVLIPREDTQCVVEAAINALKGRQNLKIIDLCSGTGAIAISLAKELDCSVLAVELYDEAFSYLEKNIRLNGTENVRAFKADVLKNYDNIQYEPLDLIISNPPYIESDEIKTLQTEVQFEPKTALDGGADGLMFYRSIIKNWSSKLRCGGMLCFELGEGQYESVRKLMENAGFENIGFERDLGEIKRCIYGFLK